MATTTLTPFASAQQMEQRSEGAISKDRPFLDSALRAASDVIRGYCGWHVAPEISETLHLDGPDSQLLVLPSLRVAEVTGIVEAGQPADLTDIAVSRTGMLRRRRPFADTFASVEVTLRHGFENVPDAIVDLTLQIAARALGSPLGVVREQSLIANVTWTTTAAGVAGGTVLMAHEEPILAPYRLGTLP